MKTLLSVLAALILPAALAAAAAPRPWDDYRVVLWTGDSAWKTPESAAAFPDRLREIGATHGMVHGRADGDALRRAGIPYYVENIVSRGLCLKWNSRVRDWDGFVTAWAKDRNREAFVREYGLCDPAWLEGIHRDVREIVTRHAPHAPLAYDLRDEISITISANPFDYDFSPATLTAFREWLRASHGSLDALNRSWGTAFASWDAVLPFTTDEIKNRMASGDAMPRGQPDWQALARLRYDPAEARKAPGRWNLAPWCDFRTFLDTAWAGILDDLRRTSHAIDPATPVGIEGTQMPHPFGGYDLRRLSQVLDWIEPYDIGGARAIFGSFMEGKPILSTIGEARENAARRRLWHLLLEGDRGCILWWSEDCIDWKAPGFPLTAKGRALAAVTREMTGPLAGLIVRARREWDPIAIHYSQPSVQVNWLIESTVDGRTWHRRFSSYESTHNRQSAQRVAWLRQLRRAGFTPRFLASDQIEGGALASGGWRALVMPGSLAMSDREAAAVRAFAAAGGTLVYEDEPAAFDERGRLRAAPMFEVRAACSNVAAAVASIAPPVRVTPAAAGVAVYRYRLGDTRLIAIERDADVRMGEDLKLIGGDAASETPVEIEVTLDRAGHVTDLRDGRRLGRTDRVRLTIDPWRPSILAVTGAPLPAGDPVAHLAAGAARQGARMQ
jgi:hypothetical protein